MLTDFRNSYTVGLSTKFSVKPLHILHHTLNVLFRYLVKLKCQNFITLITAVTISLLE